MLPAELLKPELPEVVARGGEEMPWQFHGIFGDLLMLTAFICCSGAEYQPSRSSRDSRNSREALTAQRDEGIVKRNAGECSKSLIKTCKTPPVCLQF